MSRLVEKYKLLRSVNRSRLKSLRGALTPLKLTVMWAVLCGHTVFYNFTMKDGHYVATPGRPTLVANGRVTGKGTIPYGN